MESGKQQDKYEQKKLNLEVFSCNLQLSQDFSPVALFSRLMTSIWQISPIKRKHLQLHM